MNFSLYIYTGRETDRYISNLEKQKHKMGTWRSGRGNGEGIGGIRRRVNGREDVDRRENNADQGSSIDSQNNGLEFSISLNGFSQAHPLFSPEHTHEQTSIVEKPNAAIYKPQNVIKHNNNISSIIPQSGVRVHLTPTSEVERLFFNRPSAQGKIVQSSPEKKKKQQKYKK